MTVIYRMGGLKRQPQLPVSISPRLLPFNPVMAVIPPRATTLVNGKALSFVGDAARRNGNFYFPGSDGYVDLGSDALIGATNFSLVVVTRLDSFVNAFPTFLGIKNTPGTNFMGFYSSSGGYTDITFGQGGVGVPFSLSQFGSVTGTLHRSVFVNNGGVSKLWCNGSSLSPKASQSLGASSGNSTLGQLNPGNLTSDFNGEIALFALFNGVLPDSLAAELSANPFGVFQSQTLPVYFPDSAVAPPSGGYGFVKVSGSWKTLSGTYVKVAGVWKSGHFSPKVSGSWKTLV